MTTLLKRIFVGVILLTAVSCQKAYDPEPLPSSGGSTGGGSSSGGGNPSGQISKVVVETGGITQTKFLEYDATAKLAKCSTSAVIPGYLTLTATYTFTRDNTGKITSFNIYQGVPGYPMSGADYKCHYPAGSSTFDYATSSYVFSGNTQKDSMCFSFTNGLLTGYKEYINGNLESTTDFTYDNAANLSSAKYYQPNTQAGSGGNLILQEEYAYTFDSKVNPLYFSGQEAFLLGGDVHVSKNNYTKTVHTIYATTPSTISTVNYVYTYNITGQPSSAAVTDTQNGKGTITYTY